MQREQTAQEPKPEQPEEELSCEPIQMLSTSAAAAAGILLALWGWNVQRKDTVQEGQAKMNYHKVRAAAREPVQAAKEWILTRLEKAIFSAVRVLVILERVLALMRLAAVAALATANGVLATANGVTMAVVPVGNGHRSRGSQCQNYRNYLMTPCHHLGIHHCFVLHMS